VAGNEHVSLTSEDLCDSSVLEGKEAVAKIAKSGGFTSETRTPAYGLSDIEELVKFHNEGLYFLL
jgi:hypothetical protein